jgi:hypothetical protein
MLKYISESMKNQDPGTNTRGHYHKKERKMNDNDDLKN